MSENKFVAINDVRIRVNNIKNYGVSEEISYLSKVYRILDCYRCEKERIEKNIEINKEEYEWVKSGKDAPIYALFNEADEDVFYDDYIGDYYADFIEVPEGIICHAIEREDFETAGDIMIKAVPSDVWCEEKKYLYITTFQNDNFQFYDDEIDVEQILKKIDDCLL